MRSLRSSFHRRLRQRDESGAALIAVTILIVVLTSIIAVTTSNAINDLNRATKTERRNAAYSAAEAGVADYVAKVTEDPTYFLRFVHPAESTRRSPGGFTAVGASSWNGSLAWSYPSPNNLWRALPNGFEYNLEIVPPATGLTGVKIIATGRKTGSPNDWRKLEAVVRPASVADFSFISNGDQSFGTGATTDGKMYVGVDSSGIAHDLNHRGNAYGSLFAEGQVVGMDASRLHNGAETFDSDSDPSIRSVVPTALNFNLFTNS